MDLVSNIDVVEHGAADVYDQRATSFTTGANIAGYTLDSIDVHFRNHGVNNDPDRVTAVKLYNDDGGNVGTTEAAALTGRTSGDLRGVQTYAAPPNTTLTPNTTYWVAVNDGLNAAKVGALRVINSDTETSRTGWSIGNDGFSRALGDSTWSASSHELQFRVRGSAITPHVTNLGQTTNVNELPLASNAPVANAFTIGGMSGDRFTLDSVVVEFDQKADNATVSVFSDNAGVPGVQLGSALTQSGSADSGEIVFNVDAEEVVLNGDATYWLVLKTTFQLSDTTNRPEVKTTASDAQDSSSSSGWYIADSRRSGSTWILTTSGSVHFRVNATKSRLWAATLTVDEHALSGGHLRGCASASLADCATTLDRSAFTYGGTSYSVTELVRDSGANQFRLTLEPALPSAARPSGTLTVGTARLGLADATFTSTSNGEQATWSNPGITWTDNQTVPVSLTVDTTLPRFISAVADSLRSGSEMQITFSEAMSGAKAANGAFNVRIAGAATTVTSYSLYGYTASLRLSTSVGAGQSVTVAYDRPNAGTVLRDAAGNDLASFAARTVVNRSTAEFVRAAGGFAAPMGATAPKHEDGSLRVATFNPASDLDRQSLLRLVNPGATDAHATVTGVDDAGRSPGDPVRLTVPAGAACTVDAAQLESGAGLACGASQPGLGDGFGRWRLAMTSDAPLVAMNLLSAPDGRLANLSNVPAPDAGGALQVPLFPSASDTHGRQGMLRVLNRTGRPGTVAIAVTDEAGGAYPSLKLHLPPHAAANIDATDLELGNRTKGLPAGTGAGRGPWRLTLTSDDIDFAAPSYIRGPYGFLLPAPTNSLPNPSPGQPEGPRH